MFKNCNFEAKCSKTTFVTLNGMEKKERKQSKEKKKRKKRKTRKKRAANTYTLHGKAMPPPPPQKVLFI